MAKVSEFSTRQYQNLDLIFIAADKKRCFFLKIIARSALFAWQNLLGFCINYY